jgi:ring-1,2-phenylacetyl-CoA epoxidase subunit PaaC
MSEMNTDLKPVLRTYLIAMGDDELILGHRNSEWCGHAPILEEDIAFANLALDEIGHASLWYGLAAVLLEEDPDTYPDQLAYFRSPEEYRNVRMVELPNGDWAFSMLRQFLFDAAEKIRLEALAESAYLPLAEAAAKIKQEEIYHYRHTHAWIQRLGLGTPESRERLQNALKVLWPYTRQLFAPAKDETALRSAGYIPEPGKLSSAWSSLVAPFLRECGLILPNQQDQPINSEDELPGRHQHTPHLGALLAEMQAVPRAEPQANW